VQRVSLLVFAAMHVLLNLIAVTLRVDAGVPAQSWGAVLLGLKHAALGPAGGCCNVLGGSSRRGLCASRQN